MKKLTVALIAVLLSTTFAFSGGLVTNTNQSAAWVRYFSRNATLDIDAVYFNPAGLTKLNDGFHISLNNQSIFQTWTLNNDLSLMNESEFIGDVKAPMFPSVYAAYKMGKLAFSFGFNIIGGGGGAEFTGGVPMVEMLMSSLPVSMAPLGAPTGYSYESYLKGQSAYFGYQAGVSYEINDMLSVYAGARYVMVNNSYEGYIRNISVTGGALGDLTNASLTSMSAEALAGSVAAGAAGDGLQPAINGGAGTLTFQQMEDLSLITPSERAQLEGGLIALGVPQGTIDVMDMNTAQTTYYTGRDQLFAGSEQLAGASAGIVDQELETKQTGSGITPIIGANISLMDGNLNIGLKYEFMTDLNIKNETVSDVVLDPISGASMYPDGQEISADMPAMISAGVTFKPMEKLELSGGVEYYFDKGVDWDGREEYIDANMFNANVSAQYALNEKFLVSAGYNYAKTGVTEDYQTDLSFSLSSSSIGFGGAWNIMENLQLNLGYAMVIYMEDEVPGTFTSTYGKATKMFAAGVNYSF